MSWDSRWIDLAKLVASWSKDRSTKCGAVIVDKRQVLLGVGWNGFPRGLDDDAEERHERPMKYLVTEHSERNALFNAAAKGISTEGATMYVATLGNRLFVCADCARGIIQSGIHQVVIPKPDYSEQWGESCDIAFAMLRECGVEVRIID